MGQRNNVVETLEGLGADVSVYENLGDIMEPNQLYTDIVEAGISNTQGFDWYWLNVEGFFEDVFLYGANEGGKLCVYSTVANLPNLSSVVLTFCTQCNVFHRYCMAETYGPVWRRQNNNFDGGSVSSEFNGSQAWC